MYKMPMPKSKIDTTMEELDELMSQAEMDSARLASYLQRKVEEHKKPKKNDRLFARFSFDMDLDVNALKKPKQPPPAEPSDVQPLKERASGVADAGDVVSEKAKEPPADPSAIENKPPTPPPAARTSPNLSPNRRRSLRSGNVPGSDKLRRHAIRRRSQSCGRQLIKEFEASMNVTRSSSSPTTFKPAISSTPCALQPPKDNIQAKEPAESPKEKQLEKPEAEKSQVAPEPKKGVTTVDARVLNTAAEASLMYRERQSSYQNNILQLDYTGRAPYSRPGTPTSPSTDGVRRTYIIEKGPAPGQLLLSPSRPGTSPAAQRRSIPLVKLRRTKDILVPDTPPRALTWGSQPEPECVVPDTQPQDLSALEHNLVKNTTNPKPNAERASVVASAPLPLTPLHRASTVVSSGSLSPAANCPSSPAANCPSSPAATGSSALAAASPAKLAESPKSSRTGLIVVGNMADIMTDDENDEQPSTVAMNLAPSGGDTTRQRRLRNHNNRPHTPDRIEDSSVQLLNLHRSITAKELKRKTKPATVPLNKAPSAPINGEQFAKELARMSNYEILDLRKRNSQGKVCPLNGRRKRSAMQQLNLERNIQFELMRRNLPVESPRSSGDEEVLSPRVTNGKRKRKQRSSHSKESNELHDDSVMPPPPPLNFNDTRKPTQQSPQSRRQNPLMSEESTDEYETLPPPAPHDFEDSSKQMQRSLRARHRSSRTSDESADVNEKLAPPVPSNFEDSRKQTQRSRRSSRKSRRKSDESTADVSWMPPSAPSAFKDTSKRSRRRRHTLVSKELSNYLMISQTMETRRRTIRDSTKRTLYTKGDSHAENSDSDSPEKRSRYSRSLTSIPNREEDVIEIVPPPPVSLRYSQSLYDLRQINHIELDNVAMAAPHEEIHGSEENAITEIAAPPPENIAPESVKKESEHDVIMEEASDNDQPREPDLSVEQVLPPPAEYNERPDEVETGSTQSPVREIAASQSRSASTKKTLHNQSAAKASQESKLSSSYHNGQTNKKKKMVRPSTEYDVNTEKAGNNAPLRSSEQALPPPTENSESESDESGTELAQSLARVDERRSASAKKKAKVSQKPGLERVSSSHNKSNSRTEIEKDHEEPSTSLAAREALQRSTQKAKSKPQVVADDETVFKKPLAPAPRAKTKSSELEKLMHSVLYFPASMDDGSITSEGIRRSRRGHVPIKNTWCHTQDIMEMPFMTGSVKKPKSKNKTTTTKSVEKKKSTAQKKSTESKKSTETKKTVSSNPPPDRGPLYSSTPRIPDRTVEPFPESVSLGLEPLNWEQSSLSQNTQTSTRPSAETNTESHLNPEPVVIAAQTSNMDNQVGTLLQLASWLRGTSSDPPCNMTEQSSSASLVGDMRFTELDGIDYAFYNTKEKATVGYMRFKPHQVRNKKRAKVNPLKFIVYLGEFAVQYEEVDAEEEKSSILRAGDMIEIDKGVRYSIQNILNDVSVLLVIRC